MLAKASSADKPMLGIGDPVFATLATAPLRTASARGATKVRGYASYFHGDVADLEALRQGLEPLPETADELKAVAQKLGAPASDLLLGAAATETAVKRANLRQFRVVYFATHGLVAGEVKGLAEPALVLSLPKQPSEIDDGLLTASEVTQLQLDAEWVVLSACNTAAGETPGAEGLSGLARAFFYAGTRALLVSHWQVQSEAAVALTTGTFAAMKANPGIGRAEALRRAMLALMGDSSSPLNPHPAVWAPFVVVGEGGAEHSVPRLVSAPTRVRDGNLRPPQSRSIRPGASGVSGPQAD